MIELIELTGDRVCEDMESGEAIGNARQDSRSGIVCEQGNILPYFNTKD